jgi:serine/threonine-protein kinase RsbW
MSEGPWVWQFDTVIPSSAGAGRCVMDDLIGRLREHCWPERDVFGVQLAMEEALVNAIKHGNGWDVGKQLHVVCKMASNLVRIEIADEGAGFDPKTLPDPTDEEHIDLPRGRGVMLIRSFMTRVEYVDRGNRVVMEKVRAAG